MFFVPKYNKNGVMKQEFTKYMANIEHYPFQMYIHWQPADVGSIVYSDRKSLVDVRMTASVVTDFYRDGITSFIIVSSDSDFWRLIESLPKAKFLVMYEYEKCGTAIKNALAQHGIYYCAIDVFCTAGTEELKRAVLFAELEKHLPSLVGENPLDLTHKIYEATRVTATMKEMENFCNRYVKTLRLKVNFEGKFEIEI